MERDTPRRSDRTIRLAVRLGLVVALACGLLAAAAAAARQAPPADWEAIGPAGPVRRLFATADGVLLAETGPPGADGALLGSDDGGASFRPIPLPARPSGAASRLREVDPSDARIIYVNGEGGLHQSDDGGTTYRLILPEAPTEVSISVSPADRQLIYVAEARGMSYGSRLRFLRSRDGGATFEQLEERTTQRYDCTFGVSLLEADATDSARVFRAASCVAGRDMTAPTFTRALEVSPDQGATWTVVARPRGGFADRLVGGRGAAPNRYYLSDFKAFLGTPASLYRSDDGGGSFAEVFQLPQLPRSPSQGGPGQQTQIDALAYDPATPDRMFLGRRNRRPSATGAEGVLVSQDGGQSFAELGRQDIGEVRDLALSADGQTLYAATSDGLFRLALAAGGFGSPVSVPAPAQTPDH